MGQFGTRYYGIYVQKLYKETSVIAQKEKWTCKKPTHGPKTEHVALMRNKIILRTFMLEVETIFSLKHEPY